MDEHVVHAIRQVLAGEVYVSRPMRQRMLQGMAGHRKEEASAVDRLSDRELEVFRLLGSGKGTREIAEHLHLSVKTIETYRAHIKVKLNLNNASELVHSAVRWVEEQAASN